MGHFLALDNMHVIKCMFSKESLVWLAPMLLFAKGSRGCQLKLAGFSLPFVGGLACLLREALGGWLLLLLSTKGRGATKHGQQIVSELPNHSEMIWDLGNRVCRILGDSAEVNSAWFGSP